MVDILMGRGICTDLFFPGFCKQTEAILGLYVANKADIKEKILLAFLSTTLPRIVDILLRRSTKRY
jgi:hypothetical protein